MYTVYVYGLAGVYDRKCIRAYVYCIRIYGLAGVYDIVSVYVLHIVRLPVYVWFAMCIRPSQEACMYIRTPLYGYADCGSLI